jgi:hypothetical protein
LFRFIEKSKAVHFGLDGGKAGLRNYALLQPRDGGEFEALKIAGLDLQAGDKIVAIGGVVAAMEIRLNAIRRLSLRMLLMTMFQSRVPGMITK